MFLVDGVTYFQRRRRQRTKERRGMREEEMNNKKDEWSGEEWVGCWWRARALPFP